MLNLFSNTFWQTQIPKYLTWSKVLSVVDPNSEWTFSVSRPYNTTPLQHKIYQSPFLSSKKKTRKKRRKTKHTLSDSFDFLCWPKLCCHRLIVKLIIVKISCFCLNSLTLNKNKQVLRMLRIFFIEIFNRSWGRSGDL